jgi:RNA polymerase sigma factor (sigma-70 family)
MQLRKTPIEMFATFAQLSADRFEGWSTDAQLQGNMKRQMANIPQTSEQFWTLYWYQFWQQQSHSFAFRHLIAYLQEAALWAAQKRQTTLYNSAHSLADYFQMAMLSCDRVLQGYDPQYGSRLKDYAKAVFHSAIKNTLRQQGDIDICSDWALLRKISQKRLLKALKLQGHPPETCDRYRLAWDCYKAVHNPKNQGSQRLPPPTPAHWDAIAHLYNQQRQQQLSPGATAIAPEILQTWLHQCTQAIRAYLYPPVLSLNAPLSTPESSEWLETLRDSPNQTTLDRFIQDEEEQRQQQHRQQIEQTLTEAIAALSAPEQTLLQLYYQQQLTQSEIAQKLDSKQYTVSRRLSRLRAQLLKALVQSPLAISAPSLAPDTIHQIGIILEEWLTQYFRQSQAEGTLL